MFIIEPGGTPCRVASVTGSGVTIVCGDEYTLIPAKVTAFPR